MTTTLTNSKGKVFSWSDTELNNILASLNTGDISYYRVRHDIIFIKITSNLLLIFDYTYNFNRIIFENYDIVYHSTNDYNLNFIHKITTVEYDIHNCYTNEGYLNSPVNPLSEVYLAEYDNSSSDVYITTHDLVKSSGIFGGDSAVLKTFNTTTPSFLSYTNDSNNFNINIDLSSKQDNLTGATSNLTSTNLTANRALISNNDGKIIVSNITATEISYLDNTTGYIQTQLDNKANSSDVYTKSETYTKTEIDNEIASIVDSAPDLLNTLNELAAALNDDENFATTIEGQINAKEDIITGGATTITQDNLTSNRALISNASGKVAVSDITSTELGYLDGVSSNIQTQIDAKQDTINLTANRATESDGSGNLIASAITSTELGYLDGVSSNIQTQIDAKQDIINLTANRATETDGSGNLIASVITSAELGYLDGVSSNIQTQLDGKFDKTGGTINYTGSDVALTITSSNSLNWELLKLTQNKVNNGCVIRFEATDADDDYVFGLHKDNRMYIYQADNGYVVYFDTTNIDFNSTNTNVNGNLIVDSLTANRALVSDGSKKIISSAITSTELGYLDNVSSNIQTQLNNKLNLSGGTINYTGSSAALNITSNSGSWELLKLNQTNSSKGSVIRFEANDADNDFAIGLHRDNRFYIHQIGSENVAYFDATNIDFHSTNTNVNGNLNVSGNTILDYNSGTYGLEVLCGRTSGLYNVAKFKNTQSNMGVCIDFQTADAGAEWALSMANGSAPDFKILYSDMPKLSITTGGDLTVANNLECQNVVCETGDSTNALTIKKTRSTGEGYFIELDSSDSGGGTLGYETSIKYTSNDISWITGVHSDNYYFWYVSTVGMKMILHTDGKLELPSMTASRVVITSGSGKLDSSTITSTELGYLLNCESNIQGQLDDKLNLSGGTITGNLEIDGRLKMTKSSTGTSNSLHVYNTTNDWHQVLLESTSTDIGAGIYFRTKTWSNDFIIGNRENSAKEFYFYNNSNYQFRLFGSTGNATLRGTLTENSDKRLKTNITDVDEDKMINIFNNINVKKYNRIDKENEEEIGIIADDLQEVLGDEYMGLIDIHDVDENVKNMKSISYSKLSLILWSVVKKQQRQIDELIELVNKPKGRGRGTTRSQKATRQDAQSGVQKNT
jgi:hypothetical protein